MHRTQKATMYPKGYHRTRLAGKYNCSTEGRSVMQREGFKK